MWRLISVIDQKVFVIYLFFVVVGAQVLLKKIKRRVLIANFMQIVNY